MKSNFGGFNSTALQAVKDFGGEVQSGGGSGDGTTLLRVHGLVAIAVRGAIIARNIGRQWDVAKTLDRSEKVAYRQKADTALAKFSSTRDLGLQLVVLSEKQAF